MRIEYENATDQVLVRGNRREAIFRDDRDRTEFLRRLEIVCGRMGWSIRAYVLMDNHYHLVLHTPLPNLVEGMKWFQDAQTRYFNCRHRGWGRVFGDRYQSIPAEEPVSFGGRGTVRGEWRSVREWCTSSARSRRRSLNHITLFA